MSQQNIVVVLGANIAPLQRAMAMAQAQVSATAHSISNSMSGAENTVKEKTSGMTKAVATMRGAWTAHMTAMATVMKGSLWASLSGLIPIASVAGTHLLALGGAVASAGAGFAGFGAVATGVLGKVFTATDKTYGNLDAQQKRAYKSLKDFKTFFANFNKGFEGGVVDIFTQSLGVLENVMTKMKPAIQGTMEAVGKLVGMLSQSINAPDIQAFFDWMGKTAGGFVVSFGQIFGNVFRGVINLLMAFTPMSQGVVNGLLGMTQAFAKWSQGLAGSQGFQQFIQYVQANTPLVTGLIKGLVSTVWNLLVVLAPLGSVFLGAVSGIVQGLSAITGQIKQAFSVQNFQAVGVALAGLIPMLAQVLANAMPAFLGQGMNIVGNIIQGIAQAVPNIVTAVIGLLQVILNNMMANYPLIINAGLQLCMALINGIISALPQLISQAMMVIQTLVTTLMNAVVTYLPMIVQSAVQLVLMLIQGIVTALPMLVQMASNLITVVVGTILQQLPVLLQGGVQIVMALVNGIITMLPQIINTVIQLVQTILTMLVSQLPAIINAGIQLINALINGIIQMLPMIIQSAMTLINALLNAILSNLPQIIQSGVQLLLALVNGVTKSLPMLVQMAVTLILQLVGAILSHLPQIISAGVQIIVALAGGLIKAIPQIIACIPSIISAIFNAFAGVDWGSIGSNIIKGIGSGLSSMGGWIKDKISGMATGLLDSAKSALGIHSPSRLFRDEVGKFIPQGIAVGIHAQGKVAMDAVGDVGKDLVLTGKNLNLNDKISANIPSLAVGGAVTQAQTGGEYHFTIPLTIDGREVAKATVKYNQDELDKLQNRQNRLNGQY